MARKVTEPIKAKELVRMVPEPVREKIKVTLSPKYLRHNEQKLQNMDFHAYYKHYRFDDGSAITECFIENSKRRCVAVGYSICSHLDEFCRADGRVKSLGRAVAALEAESNQFPIANHGNNKNQAMNAFLLDHKCLAKYLHDMSMYCEI